MPISFREILVTQGLSVWIACFIRLAPLLCPRLGKDKSLESHLLRKRASKDLCRYHTLLSCPIDPSFGMTLTMTNRQIDTGIPTVYHL